LIDNFSIEVEEWLPIIDLVSFAVDVVDYPTDVYSSGTITITIHAENDNTQIKEENYYLLYGYHCEFEEIVDWGYKKEVAVTMDAENLVFCPSTESEAFYFETADLHSYDLGATLQAVESVDLNATIYPQNTFFFYERTYTITISGIRDFAGNEMPDSIFSFTIENE